jgi:hypothetical protein
MEIRLVIVAWGRAYLERLTTQALPSLLAEGNLPALAGHHRITCLLYSTPEDATAWAGDPSLRALERLLPVRWLDIGEVDPEAEPLFQRWPPSKFKTMSICHLDAMRRAWADGAGLLFVAPDNLFSNGCGAQVAAAIEDGCRAALISHLPVLEATFLPALDTIFPPRPDGTRPMPGRTLTRLALEHMHPDCAEYFTDGASFRAAAHLYWRVGSEGHLARAFHVHPLFVHPRRPTEAFFHSVDNDWTAQVLDAQDPVRIFPDSDLAALIEPMPPGDKATRPQPHRFTPLRWVLGSEGLFPSPHSLRWAGSSIRWHREDLSPAWPEAEALAERTVREIRFWHGFLDPANWPAEPLDPERLREVEALCVDLEQEAGRFEREGGANPLYSWANLAKLSAALGQGALARRALVQMRRLAGGNPHTLARAGRLEQRLLEIEADGAHADSGSRDS